MKISAKTILAVIVVLLLGCVQTPDLTAATRTPARTSKTAKKSKSGKASSAKPSMSLMIKALQTGPSVSRVNSVATLDKELAKAKAFETKFDDVMKTKITKRPDGKFSYEGSMAVLLYEIERYRDAMPRLEKYIASQPKYNGNNMQMVAGAEITSSFADFLVLQHINDLVALIPAESQTAFKDDMVKLFDLHKAFVNMMSCESQMQGVVWQGSSVAMEYAYYWQQSALKINEWMLDIWEILKDKSGSAAYSTSAEVASRLLNKFRFDSEYGIVSSDDFYAHKNTLSAAADKFINGYGQWLESYPGYPAELKDQPARLLSDWEDIKIDE